MKQAVAILMSLALLAWLLVGGHLQRLAAALSGISPGVLLLAALGLAASYLLRALRVYEEYRRDARGRFGACLRIVLIHNAMVNVLPFRGGEAAFPTLLRTTFGTPLPRAVASLLWFRLQDAFVVAMAAVLVWPALPLSLRIAGLALLGALAWALPRWARRLRGRPGGKTPTRFGKLLSAF